MSFGYELWVVSFEFSVDGLRGSLEPMRVPRVAYFPDSFHEVNGVAHTSRNFWDMRSGMGCRFFVCGRDAGDFV